MPLRFKGKLHSWNEDRGFGFVRPYDGGQDLFVHVSALPPGPHPAGDEVLTFEIALDGQGRKRAVLVRRQAAKAAALAHDRERMGLGRRPEAGTPATRRGGSHGFGAGLLGLVVTCAIAAYVHLQPQVVSRILAPAGRRPEQRSNAVTEDAAPFRCDGRTRCSQMHSCAEAKFFLKHCPATRMDGNHDGIPCEQQWCTGG